MNRHLPYLFSVLKTPLALAALAWLIHSGRAAGLAAATEALAAKGSLLPSIAMWFLLLMGLMLLLFPLNLMEEHLLRFQEGEPEEMPARQWLVEFAWELGIRLAVGVMISAAMLYLHAWWWAALSAAWVLYHALQPLIQQAYLNVAEDEGDARHPPALPEIHRELADRGIRIDRILLVDEEEMAHVAPDVYFARRKGQPILYVPQSWAREWTTPELIAACLHKAWMNRPGMRAREILLNAAVALAALGGYALADAPLRAMSGAKAMAEPAAIPGIIAWMAFCGSILKAGGLAVMRRWILAADDAVARQMNSADGMTAALKRAQADGGTPPPRWAEALFSHAPSLERRLDRLAKRQN